MKLSLACLLVLSVGWRAEGLRRTPNLPDSESPYLFFTAFHKTGTALVNHLCDHMKRAVTGAPDLCSRCQHILNATEKGTYCAHIWSDGHTRKWWPEFYNNTEHYFAGTQLGEVMNKAGKNWRLVASIRDPLTAFASAFIYDQKGGDHSGAGKKELEGLPMDDALRVKAKDGLTSQLMQKMLEAHRLAKQDARIILVRFEDFKGDYDKTASRIFDFMTNSGHEDQKPSFLKYAAVDDQHRWEAARMQQTHVSNPDHEQKVVDALRGLCAKGDKAVADVLAAREEMGYGVKCPGPSDP